MDFYEIRQKEEKFFVDYDREDFTVYTWSDGCFFKQPLVYIKKRTSIKHLLQNCMKSI